MGNMPRKDLYKDENKFSTYYGRRINESEVHYNVDINQYIIAIDKLLIYIFICKS